MAFSSIKRIFSNYVKLWPVNSYCSSVFAVNFRTSTALNKFPEPLSINRIFRNTPESLRIEFNDSLSANFHYIWLRDNCNCPKCVNPITKQKLLDTVSLDLKIAPRGYHVTETGALKMIWYEKQKEHFSHYDPLWLHRYALGFESKLYEAVHDSLPSPTCWAGKYLEENLPEVQYEEVMNSKDGIYLTLERIYKFGILFVRNVPREPGEVVKVLNRIAHVKNSIWGSSYHITANDILDNPAYFPYTEENVELHTDMDYLESSPGVQALHCLQTTSKNLSHNKMETSGGTYFVDGFYIANCLRKHHPLHFETLVSIPVKFRMITQNMQYMDSKPIFKLNRLREITEVHFGNKRMAPLEGPSTSILNFYAAVKIFGENVRKRENQFRMALKPGDMVILNNRRVLHGRGNFDPNQITKHLEGCFADVDEVLASYRALACLRTKTNAEKQ